MAQSFLEVARELIDSPEAKTAYADDPNGFMAARGLDGLSATDLEDAVGFVAETVPAPVARQMAAAPGAVADPAPLARLAAASAVEAAVVEVESGTVDLTALVDPTGQFDLPTVSPAPEPEVGASADGEEDVEEPEEADEPTTEASDAGTDDAFGVGAGGAEDEDDTEDGDEEPDGEGSTDDGVLPRVEPDPIGVKHSVDHDSDALESADAGPLRPVEPPEERVEDEFEEMI